jgi:hypothetical protein
MHAKLFILKNRRTYSLEALQHLLTRIQCYKKLELIAHTPRVPWCIASATDRFNPGEIRLIEHAQDSLV